MDGPRKSRKSIASIVLAVAIGLALTATITVWATHPSKRPPTPKVIVGTKDEVYYYHAATKEDAQTLGQALMRFGFLNGRGTTVLLSKGTAGTIVSFVVNDGAWDHPVTIYTFEEIGRRIAPAIGGFPIKVRLIDSERAVRKELTVGRVAIGARDEVYYFASAGEMAPEADALGHALQSAGFFADRGASVVLSTGDGTAISFVLDEGAWERPDALAGFERLVRRVASSIGGLPVKLRLLSPSMEPKKEWMVR
jgi:hypothetical protein